MTNKKDLRNDLIKAREAMNEETVQEKSQEILERLFELEEVNNAETVMIYMSFRNEVDTNGLFLKLLRDNKDVVAGKCIKETKEIIPINVNAYKDFELGNYGIIEPILDEDKIAEIKDIDVIIIPGVGFSSSKDRIGFGAGYYDRFLPRLRDDAIKIAIAFEEQLVDEIPTDEYDVKMDIIVTDKEIIR